MIWRYSSSATVACSWDIRWILSRPASVRFRPWPSPSRRRSSRSSRARARSCRRATTGATSRSGTASARSCSATATTCTSRAATGKPMNRYFPEIEEQVRALPGERLVLDGEMVVEVDGIQEFDLLSQRIHPAASRVERLAEETPAALVAFDLLAEGDELLLELPYDERRERLAAGGRRPGAAHAGDRRPRRRRAVAHRAAPRAWWPRRASAPYLPGRAQGHGRRSSACARPTRWWPPSASARRRAPSAR